MLASLGLLDDVMTIATSPLMIGAHGPDQRAPICVRRKHLEKLCTKVGIERIEGSKTALARLKSQDIEVNEEYEYIVAADGAHGVCSSRSSDQSNFRAHCSQRHDAEDARRLISRKA